MHHKSPLKFCTLISYLLSACTISLFYFFLSSCQAYYLDSKLGSLMPFSPSAISDMGMLEYFVEIAAEPSNKLFILNPS